MKRDKKGQRGQEEQVGQGVVDLKTSRFRTWEDPAKRSSRRRLSRRRTLMESGSSSTIGPIARSPAEGETPTSRGLVLANVARASLAPARKYSPKSAISNHVPQKSRSRTKKRERQPCCKSPGYPTGPRGTSVVSSGRVIKLLPIFIYISYHNYANHIYHIIGDMNLRVDLK